MVKKVVGAQRTVYLSLGSNIGDRLSYLRDAITQLSLITHVVGVSSVYETEPWGYNDPAPYLNMVCALATDLDAEQLHTALLGIEQLQGRASKSLNSDYSARTLDIDILFFGNDVIQTSGLVVPHPRIEKRKFVLVPLAEIASGYRHPVTGLSIADLLEQTPDRSGIAHYADGV